MRPTFYPTVWFRGKLPRRSVPRPQSFADSLLRFGLPGHQLTVCRQTAYLVCGLIAEASVGGARPSETQELHTADLRLGGPRLFT